MSNSATAVSAPGKVLLAGGYLALDRKYTGLVFGLSARINVVAKEIQTSPGIQLSEIVVESPQFLEAQWRYGYHLADEDGGIKVTQLHLGSQIRPNPFVETTLSYALTYIARAAHHRPSHTMKSVRLTILADNDYYSQPGSTGSATASGAGGGPAASASPGSSSSTTPLASSINAGGRFARFPTTLGGANKTGLGSSAALVTALTAALLSHYLDPAHFDLAGGAGRAALHNLAQAAHCAAQGKVGSGFDVAAAVYGSCLYRRFSPEILAGLPEAGTPGFAPRLEQLIAAGDEAPPSSKWDTEIVKEGVVIPPGVALRMCDVDCGSQTVSMVKQVLAWRARDADAAGRLWDELQARNEALAAVLREAREGELRGAIRAVRDLYRKMGVESGVPIVPDSQMELLDALEGVDGVYGGVVPGAGGYDAVAIVVKDDDETTRRIEEFVEAWSKEKGGRVSLLGVKGEMEGVRTESLSQFEGWIP